MIGEAPGGDEEKQQRPFVGKAGKNLDEFLSVLELNREDIFITNVVKLRPVKINEETKRKSNRPPNKTEIEFFSPFLFDEIEMVNPKIIITLGNVPLKTVLKDNKITIGSVHGTVVEKDGRKYFPLYHPASIIYNRSLKDTYNEDLYKLKEILKSL